ncbi:MAG: LPS export ABC transporter periplasmic protein LptC [Pseudomonadota bacterium]|nr:LPS export ABC transporter periplasmic protein LptC [Pseudomonadota bacterium]MEE3287606.1 LPS export ABC transporter periplasmic protein LptC [Pseudomonadota bacterium]
MKERNLERAVLLGVMLALIGLGTWLQQTFLNTDKPLAPPVASHEPDYSILNFTATGRDAKGVVYVLEGDRLVHFPDDNTALIDNPHLVQYQDGKDFRHTYSDSGWVSSDGTEVLLTGHVRVVQGRTADDPGSVTTTERMKVKLKRGAGG